MMIYSAKEYREVKAYLKGDKRAESLVRARLEKAVKGSYKRYNYKQKPDHIVRDMEGKLNADLGITKYQHYTIGYRANKAKNIENNKGRPIESYTWP